jgi:YbbR domain-containing protein
MAWHPFRNLGLKALALALAILLWVTVTRDQVAERSLRVPLEFQNIPETLEITGDAPTSVDVRVRGPSGLLARIEAGEVVAVVDLRGARPGQRLFHLLTGEVRVPFGIEVSQISPPTVSLAFEPSGSRMVPVVPAVEGEPAMGYAAGRVTVAPPTVEVVGALSRLNALREATTEPVSIRNATKPVVDTVTVGVADAELRLRAPRSATVTVDIMPAPIERAVHDVPIRIVNLQQGRRASVEPARVTIILRGAREALGSMNVDGLQPWVDAGSLQPGRYALPVKLDPGADYGIARIEPPMVELRVR